MWIRTKVSPSLNTLPPPKTISCTSPISSYPAQTPKTMPITPLPIPINSLPIPESIQRLPQPSSLQFQSPHICTTFPRPIPPIPSRRMSPVHPLSHSTTITIPQINPQSQIPFENPPHKSPNPQSDSHLSHLSKSSILLPISSMRPMTPSDIVWNRVCISFSRLCTKMVKSWCWSSGTVIWGSWWERCDLSGLVGKIGFFFGITFFREDLLFEWTIPWRTHLHWR